MKKGIEYFARTELSSKLLAIAPPINVAIMLAKEETTKNRDMMYPRVPGVVLSPTSAYQVGIIIEPTASWTDTRKINCQASADPTMKKYMRNEMTPPITRNGTLRPKKSLNLPHGTCITAGNKFVNAFSQPS